MYCVNLSFLILSFILILSKSLGEKNVASKFSLKNKAVDDDYDDILKNRNVPNNIISLMNSPHSVSSMLNNKNTNDYPKKRETKTGTCEIYVGETCSQFVGNQRVYIPYPMTQKLLEEKLVQAFGVINISKDLSENCAVYAKPSLCYSAFPICRNNNALQDIINLEDHDAFTRSSILPSASDVIKKKTHQYDQDINNIENLLSQQYELIKLKNKKILNQKLRRICRNECELLENELCRKEYAIAKRHPLLGQQVPLVECSDLPLPESKESNDCLSVGISIVNNAQENDYCYYNNGESYRGIVKVSSSGKSCLRWSNQFNLQISNYVESLAGGHSYCRNPGGYEPQPWCYVDANNKMTKESCNIPKCTFDKLIMTNIYTLIGITLIIILIIIILICYYRCYKNRKLPRDNIKPYLPGKNINIQCDQNIYDACANTSQPIEMTSLINSLGNLNDNKNSLKAIKINSIENRVSTNQITQYLRDDVIFIKELGEGAFGKVYKGQLKIYSKDKILQDTIFVAVKTLKENATPKTQNDFKREVDLMTDLRHSNIICLLGVVLKSEQMCMLFEYMTNGDLHEFLINHSPKDFNMTKSNEILGQSEFLKISSQIASGMEYLADNHYVHRDLAARNCLVGDNLIVKISDFGLSRDIYSSDYYRVQSKSLLPVRWMPPESILYGKFATESDIWSFGVVLWEIYSYGLQPYYGYNNQEVIYMIRSRQLLPCPEDCPTMIYSLMIECWHEVANKRPNFTEIYNRLSNWLINQTYLTSPKNSSKIGSPVNFTKNNNKIIESQENINNYTEQVNINLNDLDVESKINKPYLSPKLNVIKQ